MKRRSDLPLAFSVFDSRGKVAQVDGVYPEALQAYRLGEKNVVRNAKVHGSLGPAVGVEETPVVLVSSGEIAINPRDDGSGILRYRILLCDGDDQAGSPLKKVDSLLLPSREVMKS